MVAFWEQELGSYRTLGMCNKFHSCVSRYIGAMESTECTVNKCAFPTPYMENNNKEQTSSLSTNGEQYTPCSHEA